MKTWHPIRLMAYSLALLALVLAVFVPLGYLELRRQASRIVPIAPTTQVVESPTERPSPGPVVSPPVVPGGTPRPGPPPAPLSASHPHDSQIIRAKIVTGDFYLRRGEFEEAIGAYQEGLQLDPSNSTLRQKLQSAIKACNQENEVLQTQMNCGKP